MPASSAAAEEPAPHEMPVRHRAVIVGHGPVGRTLARLFQENKIDPIVVEMNLDTVRKLKAAGMEAVYGDAGQGETLAAAGTGGAIALILSANGLENAKEIIRLARELNPAIRIVARTGTLRDVGSLRRAGADAVFSGEAEVALTMTEFLLRKLGATSEQAERERERLRHELPGADMPEEMTLLNRRSQAHPPDEGPEQAAGPEAKKTEP